MNQQQSVSPRFYTKGVDLNQMKESISVEMISPEVANAMLDQNVNNRILKESGPKSVEVLVRNLRNGLWKYNGATIRIARSGRLLDGQHRLHAIVASGYTLPMIVVRGLDDEVFGTIDNGRQRSAADVLAGRRYKYASLHASTARLIAPLMSGSAYRDMSSDEIADWLWNHDVTTSINTLAPYVMGSLRNKMHPFAPTPLIAAHYFGAIVDSVAADEFFRSQIAQRISVKPGDPAFLVDQLERRAGAIDATHVKNERQLTMLLWGFQTFLEGRSVFAAPRKISWTYAESSIIEMTREAPEAS